MRDSTLRALAATFIPETASADPGAWERLAATVSAALAERPAALRRQVAIFVRLLDLVARVRHGRSLAALDPATRAAFLEGFASSPVLLFRRGVWGLRTLVQMGWYTQPEVQRALGYRATAAGWDARR